MSKYTTGEIAKLCGVSVRAYPLGQCSIMIPVVFLPPVNSQRAADGFIQRMT